MRLTDEQHMLRDVARDFARTRLAPFAAAGDREERFPAEAVAELGRLGFMGMLVPETYGGAGADHVGYALALEEIAAGDGSCSTIMPTSTARTTRVRRPCTGRPAPGCSRRSVSCSIAAP